MQPFSSFFTQIENSSCSSIIRIGAKRFILFVLERSFPVPRMECSTKKISFIWEGREKGLKAVIKNLNKIELYYVSPDGDDYMELDQEDEFLPDILNSFLQHLG